MPQLQDIRMISVEGPPGAGKTRLAELLAKRLKARLVPDEIHANPFLKRFYTDMDRYALHCQVSCLISRYQQQADIAQKDLFFQKTITDYSLAKEEIYANLTLSREEFRLYEHLRSELGKRFLKPDFMIFLDARPETLLAKLQQSDDPTDMSISRQFLTEIVEMYHTYFLRYEESPAIILEMDSILKSGETVEADALVEQMIQQESGTTGYVPVAEQA